MSCPCQPREKGWLCSFFTYSCRKCHLVWWSCGCTVRLSFLYAHAHTSHLDSTCHHWELSALSCVAWVLILCVFVCVWEHVQHRMLTLCVPELWHVCTIFMSALCVCVCELSSTEAPRLTTMKYLAYICEFSNIFQYISLIFLSRFCLFIFLFVWALVRNVFRFGRKLKKLMYQHQDDNCKKKKDQKVDDSRKILEQSLKEHEK